MPFIWGLAVEFITAHPGTDPNPRHGQGNRPNVAGRAGGQMHQGWPFRRMAESRFAEHELGPGLRRDDKPWPK